VLGIVSVLALVGGGSVVPPVGVWVGGTFSVSPVPNTNFKPLTLFLRAKLQPTLGRASITLDTTKSTIEFHMSLNYRALLKTLCKRQGLQ